MAMANFELEIMAPTKKSVLIAVYTLSILKLALDAGLADAACDHDLACYTGQVRLQKCQCIWEFNYTNRRIPHNAFWKNIGI